MQTWQKNLYAIWVAELVAIIGFGFVQPFLPYFIQELGVSDLAQVELYSGLAISIHAVVMTIASPIWGSVADRYGRKLMVERAMLGGAVLYFLTAFVQDVHSLLFLRAVQGALTGTVGAATTLVASSTPKERTGYALGMLQVSVYMGALVGPLMGGVVADWWGYRAAMLVTSLLCVLATLVVFLFVRERFVPEPRKQGEGGLLRAVRDVFALPALRPVFAVRTLLRLGDRTLMPILPLFVQELLRSTTSVASATGLVVGANALSSAAGAVLLGRLGDRVGPRTILLMCACGAALVYIPQFLVTELWQLMALQVLAALFVGGTLTAVSTLLARLAPAGKQGAVYGVDTSAASIGNAVGPMVGAAIAMSLGIRSSFLVVAVIYGVGALAIFRLFPARSAR